VVRVSPRRLALFVHAACDRMRSRTLDAVATCVTAAAVLLAAAASTVVAAGGPAAIGWTPGEPYFRVGGRQAFVFGRNPTGWRVEQFGPLLQWAGESGERIVRIHLTSGMAPKGPAGAVDEAWAAKWERVFDQAAERGVYVLPVFSAWARWNDGSGGHRWHFWNRNPYNAARGGPARGPSDLLADTPTRRLWLAWMGALVRRWRGRPNLVGWEVFSELDLVTGATEEAGVRFMQRAAAVVRAADPSGRPVTASLSGIREWPGLFADPSIDLVQVHPYADHPQYRGQLDRMIIESVRARAIVLPKIWARG